MKSMFKYVLLAGTAALSNPMSYAQEVVEEEASTRLATITVNAQRRVEDLQEVPIAVSAFSAESMREKLISEPLDLLQHVPNLFGGNNTGVGSANMYYIRGLGNTESIATFDPPVGTYVDDIYIARQNANNVSFFDVEQIEVLRGPQGTLFGRNTTGGAVSVRMKKPSDTFGGYIAGGVGSFEHYMTRASVDLPVSDTLLTKVSGFYVDEEGYVDNVATGETINGQESYGLRGDIQFQISDAVTWDLAADITKDSGLNILNYDRNASPLGTTVPNGLTSDGNDRISNSGISTQSGDGSQLEQLLAGRGLGVENNSWSITSDFQVDLNENQRVNLILGSRSLEQDFVIDFFDGGLGGQQYSTGGFAVANEGEHDQLSAELKYDASFFNGAIDLVSGLYYFTEDNTTNFADVFTINVGTPPAIIPVPLLLAHRTVSNELTSKAIYAQADWHPIDDLTITLGARWTEEEKTIGYVDNRDPTTITDPALALTTANLIAGGVPTTLTKALITPRIAAEYSFNDDMSVFVSYTEGFKSGGWNARETFPSTILPFDRELAKNTEVGFRSELLDGQVRFNATAFFMDVEGLQSPSAFVRPNGSIGFLTQNFSDFENKGLELDFDVSVTPAFNLNASLGLQDAKLVNPGMSILAQIADCIATGTGAGQGVVAPDCTLSEPVRAPDFSLSLGGTYEIDMPALNAVLVPAFGIRHVSDTFTGTSNLPNSYEDGYTLVNVGANLQFDAGYSISLDCKNCTDETYVTSNLPPTTYVNDPRRIMLSLRYDF